MKAYFNSKSLYVFFLSILLFLTFCMPPASDFLLRHHCSAIMIIEDTSVGFQSFPFSNENIEEHAFKNSLPGANTYNLEQQLLKESAVNTQPIYTLKPEIADKKPSVQTISESFSESDEIANPDKGSQNNYLAQSKPDLKLIPAWGSNFCKKDKSGNLKVTIKNIGTANATRSTTTVIFYPGGEVKKPTISIFTREATVLRFKIPDECYIPDCYFKIIVDSDNKVDEENEEDNEAYSRCSK